MTPDEGLITPQLVPVTKQLILSPEAERERAQMLAELEAAEAERREDDPGYDDPEPTLAERVRRTVCAKCGHVKLCFLPARLCEPCLKRAAEAAGVPFPKAGGGVPLNRQQRRAASRKGHRGSH